jgi:hypothetical protein
MVSSKKLVKKQHETRSLENVMSYALYQFGDRVLGKAFRERENGERYDNWKVEIGILIPIYIDLISVYAKDRPLSLVASNNLTFPYHQKNFELLRPWSAYLDLNCTGQVSSLNEDQINNTIYYFSQTERNLGSIYRRSLSTSSFLRKII